jgi:transaldolase
MGELLTTSDDDCNEVLTNFSKAGVNVDSLGAQLQVEGAESFVKSWNDLLECIASKSKALKAA